MAPTAPTAAHGEDVYATVLLNDSYLPGACVLAASLRDGGSKYKRAVLVSQTGVSVAALTELSNYYDYVIPVDTIANPVPSNLYLMDRGDLILAFTKIQLWKMYQFRKIIYMDADMVSLSPPDELFNLDVKFAAAPDIGWPDCFNSGFMLLTPNPGDYNGLRALANQGVSFDGADQGLLNIYYGDTYHRLKFLYNVTPSAHYQYEPAYQYFRSQIKNVHFIGRNKPWTAGRAGNKGSGVYGELFARWWAVYDRHFLIDASTGADPGASHVVPQHVRGEWVPPTFAFTITPAPPSFPGAAEPLPETGEWKGKEPEQAYQPSEPEAKLPEVVNQLPSPPQRPYSPPRHNWDASRAPPPPNSVPEAHNFPTTTYTMSTDKTPFQPPERYPDPPKNMWYEVPKDAPSQELKPIFPWEQAQPKPTRVFAEDSKPPPPPPVDTTMSPEPSTATGVSPITPVSPSIHYSSKDSWSGFSRGNAWDVPEIERYVEKARKARSPKSPKFPSGKPSFRLTDFPKADERPSLPVTPAPVRRKLLWGQDKEELPSAQGVPTQIEWDPSAQLEKLAQQHSVLVNERLGQGTAELPPGNVYPSSDEILHALMRRRPPLSGCASPHGLEALVNLADIPEFDLLPAAANANLRPTPLTSFFNQGTETTETTTDIPQPSFTGPGAQWEKDEEPLSTENVHLEPSEEDKDVLET